MSSWRRRLRRPKRGLREGGIPIGSVLVHGGRILGRGHNRRVQRGSVVLHGEMDALENAGRQPAAIYRESILYTTLSPCPMCTRRDPALRHPARGRRREPDVSGRRGAADVAWRGSRRAAGCRLHPDDDDVHPRSSGALERRHWSVSASERASEPRERSAPAQRRARERVGESEGRSPSEKTK